MTDNLLVTLVVGALCIGGAVYVLSSAVAMHRVHDGVSRVNVLSGATGIGMPFLALGVYVHDVAVNGFDVITLIKALVAVAGFIILSSLASNALGRAAYRSGAPLDPDTSPNELAEASGEPEQDPEPKQDPEQDPQPEGPHSPRS